ncbi:hypothetical protein PIROE2DRAFT_5517, partial [Piromyces sp. E2]
MNDNLKQNKNLDNDANKNQNNLNKIKITKHDNIQNDICNTEDIENVKTEEEFSINNDENQIDKISSDNNILSSLKTLNSWNDLMNSIRDNEQKNNYLFNISIQDKDSDKLENSKENLIRDIDDNMDFTENYNNYPLGINNFESDREIIDDNDHDYDNDYKSKILKIDECFSQEEELLKALEKEKKEIGDIDDNNIVEKIDEFLNSNKFIENNIRKYNFINNNIEEYKKQNQKNENEEVHKNGNVDTDDDFLKYNNKKSIILNYNEKEEENGKENYFEKNNKIELIKTETCTDKNSNNDNKLSISSQIDSSDDSSNILQNEKLLDFGSNNEYVEEVVKRGISSKEDSNISIKRRKEEKIIHLKRNEKDNSNLSYNSSLYDCQNRNNLEYDKDIKNIKNNVEYNNDVTNINKSSNNNFDDNNEINNEIDKENVINKDNKDNTNKSMKCEIEKRKSSQF